jgi:hypothetical protein
MWVISPWYVKSLSLYGRPSYAAIVIGKDFLPSVSIGIFHFTDAPAPIAPPFLFQLLVRVILSSVNGHDEEGY